MATLIRSIASAAFMLVLAGCSSSDNERYTVTGTASGLRAPLTIGVGDVHVHRVTPHRGNYGEFSFTIPKSSAALEYLAIAEQPESQVCETVYTSVDDEASSVTFNLVCQSYRYGPNDVSDFAVSSRRTCAAIGSNVECWGNYNGSSQIDFSATYSNPRLLTLDTEGNLCFLDDDNLYCSNNDAFDPAEVYESASNIQEMRLIRNALCYIDDNGLSCAGGSSFVTDIPEGVQSPRNLSLSVWGGGCVLDAEGKPHCWGSHANKIVGDEVFESIDVSKFDVCGYGSDGVKCIGPGSGYTSGEWRTDIGVVAEFALGEFNQCAISLSGPVCWERPFPGDSLVFEHVFKQPTKVEFSELDSSKGCGLEGDQLICFGSPYNIDID